VSFSAFQQCVWFAGCDDSRWVLSGLLSYWLLVRFFVPLVLYWYGNTCWPVLLCGPGSVVGIATDYGLDGPGIDSRWGRDFPYLSSPALAPTQPLYNGYRVFSEGKKRPGRDADPSPPTSALVVKE
jgi:hypothetical protein